MGDRPVRPAPGPRRRCSASSPSAPPSSTRRPRGRWRKGEAGRRKRAMTALLAEPRAGYSPGRLLERDLWRIWEGQRFPKAALVTAAGRGAAGDLSRAAGGRAGAGLSRGDHRRAGPPPLRRRGAARANERLPPPRPQPGRAYADVVLHVVFFHDESGETALPGGGTAPVLALGGLRRLADWLERPARWGEPCRSAVERMSADGVGATLDRLGAMRFRRRQRPGASGRRRRGSRTRSGRACWRRWLTAVSA